MTKKTTSTSNVPGNNNNNGNNQQNSQTPNTPPKMKNIHKNHSQFQNQSSSSGIINSKHLHYQSHQQKQKNNKKKETPVNDGNNENVLMKKLFEAVQKQKEKEYSANGEVKRTRKATAPLPKTMNSSETYAGAAFDRAPAATSFPIPSFLRTGDSETGGGGGCSPALSTSCPLPGFNETAKDNIHHLKNLSITDLFQSQENVETKSDKSEKKKLENLTNDLRRILNLR